MPGAERWAIDHSWCSRRERPPATAASPTKNLDSLYETWTALQVELAELSTCSCQRTVEWITYDIHCDTPVAVVEAVRNGTGPTAL